MNAGAGVIPNYRIDGVDGSPWLVLSHGLGLDLTMWEPQMPALAARFRVLRYDTRGHGASAAADGPLAIEALGGDVLALLDQVGVERAHFCGFSMGGLIGMWLGIHAPQRLDRLVLAHTAARIGPESMWNQRIETVNAGGMSAISDAAMRRWFSSGFIERHPAVVGELKNTFERTSAKGYVQCCAAVRDADFLDSIARVAAPTLVISGTVDAATTLDDARMLAERIAGSKLVEIDAAHLANYEKPDEFTSALTHFLDEP